MRLSRLNLNTLHPIERAPLTCFAWTLILLSMTLNSCISEKTKVSPPSNDPLQAFISTPFSEEELAAYKELGTASMSGTAFLMMENKKALHQKGALVVLLPVSKYTEEWFQKYVIQEGECLTPTDPAQLDYPLIYIVQPDLCTLAYAVALDERILPYVRNTITDAAGHFAFAHLPPGEYFVVARITSLEAQYFIAAIAHSRVKVPADQHLTNVGVSRKVDTNRNPSG